VEARVFNHANERRGEGEGGAWGLGRDGVWSRLMVGQRSVR
jgi:hypothetical protein